MCVCVCVCVIEVGGGDILHFSTRYIILNCLHLKNILIVSTGTIYFVKTILQLGLQRTESALEFAFCMCLCACACQARASACIKGYKVLIN